LQIGSFLVILTLAAVNAQPRVQGGGDDFCERVGRDSSVTQSRKAIQTGYRPPRGSMLAPYQAKIHASLAENAELSAVRILDLIREEGYLGQISILRAYVR
jgi:hypothetical protein